MYGKSVFPDSKVFFFSGDNLFPRVESIPHQIEAKTEQYRLGDI